MVFVYDLVLVLHAGHFGVGQVREPGDFLQLYRERGPQIGLAERVLVDGGNLFRSGGGGRLDRGSRTGSRRRVYRA
jgi:hypothetical protein